MSLFEVNGMFAELMKDGSDGALGSRGYLTKEEAGQFQALVGK